MTKQISEKEILGFLDDHDLYMLIEVLDALEESYNLDVAEGIDRSEDNELIPWARRVRKILAQAIEEANSREMHK